MKRKHCVLIGFALGCAALTAGQSCLGPNPAPQPPPPAGGNNNAPPQVTSCGLIGNNCEVLAGNGPDWVAIADFDTDGDNDIAVANFGGGSVSILLNDGFGTFTRITDLPAGSTPHSLLAADFNGDALPDLAVGTIALVGGPGATVFLNRGNAEFSPGTSYPAGDVGGMLTTADLDGDGSLDLVIAQPFSTDLPLLFGDGAGGFGAPVSVPMPGHSIAVAADDFDGDGSADLAVAHEDDSTVTILQNNGLTGFFAPVVYAVGRRPQSLAAADLDGDGHVDLVTVNEGNEDESDGTLSILMNTGNGTFAAAQTIGAGADPVFIVAVDLNGDHRADLAIADMGSDLDSDDWGVGVLLNRGDGTFGQGILFAAGDGPIALAAGDLDGDGDPDLAVADFIGDTLILLGNDGSGYFGDGG